MDVLTKAYPTIPLSSRSELVRRYLSVRIQIQVVPTKICTVRIRNLFPTLTGIVMTGLAGARLPVKRQLPATAGSQQLEPIAAARQLVLSAAHRMTEPIMSIWLI